MISSGKNTRPEFAGVIEVLTRFSPEIQTTHSRK
jgi:hypothetical protein